MGKILFIAGFPPPASGQLIMQKKMYDLFRDEDKRLISLNFSADSKDFSKMSLKKLLKMMNVVWQITIAGLSRNDIEKAYYSLSGPKKSALIKDILVGLPLNLFFKDKLVLQVHAGGYNKDFVESPFLFSVVQRLYRNTGHLLCLTEFQKNELAFLRPRASTIVYNFCEDKAPIHSEKGVQGHLKLLSVGHLNENKGIIECIKLAGLMVDRKINFHWKFIGSFKDKDFQIKIRSMISELNLGNHVAIIDEMNNAEILKEYGKADFLIFLSNGPEGQPVVLIEALMVAQAVVIAKDICGISEYIHDGANGFIVHDYREVLRLVANAHNLELDKIRSGARQSYLTEFSVRSFTNTVQSIFKKSLQNH